MQRLLRLSPDRTLEWLDHGPEEGRALLLFHGFGAAASVFPASRTLPDRLGLRLLAPNRPGVGATSLYRYGVEDIIKDVRRLLDQLELSSCSVLGWGAGAVYAMALAEHHPELLRSLDLVAPALPMANKDVTPALSPRWKSFHQVHRYFPIASRLAFRNIARQLQRDPDRVLRQSAADMPEPDQRIALGLEFQALLLSSALDGFANEGRGVSADAYALSRVRLHFDRITTGTRIWQGAEDRVWPASGAHWLQSQLPKAELHLLPDAGHLLHFSNWERILEAVARPTSA